MQSRMNEQQPNFTPAENKPNRGPLVLGFFALLAAIVLWGLWKVLESFVTPILLAAVIVVLTRSLYERLRRRLNGRDRMAAILMILAVTVVIILPTAVLLVMLIDQATSLVAVLQKTNVQEVINSTHLAERLQRYIPGVRLPSKLDLQGGFLSILRQLPGIVASRGGAVLGGVADLIMGYFFMLFAMFFFYSDGERFVRQLEYLSPLPKRYGDELILKFKQVITSTFRGHVLTALAQGVLTGIGLAICGVPGGVFWAAVATIFALVPLVGAAVVWVPAAIYLFIDASYHGTGMGWGIFMVLWGVGPVSLIDNFIRPWAMKSGSDMPAVLLLFSIIGGIRAFGIMGILLGPLIFALVASVIEIYKDFFGTTLDKQEKQSAR